MRSEHPIHRPGQVACLVVLGLGGCSAKPYTPEMVCDDFQEMVQRKVAECNGNDALVDALDAGFEALTCAVLGPDDSGVGYIDDYWHDTCILPISDLDCATVDALGSDVERWVVAGDARCGDMYTTAADTGGAR